MKSEKKIAVIIPSYNEGKILGKLIPQISKNVKAQIIVANDGSTDDTISVVKNSQQSLENIHLLNHIVNVGPFVAVQTGVRYGLLLGCEYFIQVDGDGQHPPDKINQVLEPVLQGEADLVIGSRYLSKTDYKTSVTRRVGIAGSSKAVSVFGGVDMTDVNSGFRAFNVKSAKKILKEYHSTNTVFEFTLKICKEGFRVKEVPISMEQREFGKSYLSPKRLFLYPFRITYEILKTLL